MKISAIVPVYNGGNYIAQAVKSIQRQNYPGIEIIVVDDGSTDHTASVVSGLKGVRYEYQKNQGPGAARNHGLRLATGDVIAFSDADDRWTDDKLAIQIPLLESASRPEMVIGHVQLAVLHGAGNGSATYENVGVPVFYLHLGSTLIRKHVFEEIGVFAERSAAGEEKLSGQFGEDLGWYLRAKEAAIRMRFHREAVQFYCRHSQNLTLDRASVALSTVREMKRSLDRRRAGKQMSMLDWSRETSFE